MADFNKPANNQVYTTVLEDIRLNVNQVAKLFEDGTGDNKPTGAIRLNKAQNRFEDWNGSNWVARAISISGGGTGATSATAARTNLGLGTIATQNSNAVSITGGNISASLTGSTGLAIAAGTTGTLPVNRGGTGVTTSTGTGSVVRATSPTLSSPNLGTPTAVSLVNATGLPIVDGTTGVLSILRGGTGSSSASGARTNLGLNTGNNVQFNSFGVGVAPSTTAGEIRATNNITAYFSSDNRLKENIKTIPNALEKVEKLNGVTYNWTEDYIASRGGEDGYFIRKEDVGVIAQEVKEVFPELVAENSEGYLSVRYDRLVAVLIEAVKELSKEITELKKGIS